MIGYILRRLLLMLPTFFGILVINFAVLRLQGPTLAEQMMINAGQSASGGGRTSERQATSATRDIENYLDRFRRAGLDLPALINTRGFWDESDVQAMLRNAAGDGPNRDRPSARHQAETNLWLAGHFAVAPLVAILRDPAQATLHAPAATALTFCAYTTLSPRDAERLPQSELSRIQSFNDTLRQNRIAYDNTREHGFVSIDRDDATKRTALLALFDNAMLARYAHSSGAAWSALTVETGFTDFLTKLFTGNLYSESRKEYVFTIIADRWYISFWFNLAAILIAWGVAVPLGIRSARRLGTWEDRVTTSSLFLLWSLPSFFIGTLLLYHFCTDGVGAVRLFPNLGLPDQSSLWKPTAEWLVDILWHAALPLVVLSYASFTALSRYLRGNLLEQLDSDYVRSARAKGCDEDRIVYGHAMRNSLITLITLGSGLLSDLFGGSIVVEVIFSIPGLGWLMLDAAIQQDAPLLMASTVISVALLLVGILIADILYAVVDPRLRSRYA